MMLKILKVLLWLINTISIFTIVITIISTAVYLVETDIVSFKYNWLKPIYFFGLGVILYSISDIWYKKFKSLD